MTLFLVGLAMVIALGFWMYSRGQRDKEADVMEATVDQAKRAAEIDEHVDGMSAGDIDAALLKRLRNRP